MALGAGLIDAAGHSHEMIGLLGLETSFAARRMNLGYRRAELVADCPLGVVGEILMGHEFHYASVLSSPDAPLFKMQNSDGETLPAGGSRRGHVTGTFFHFIDK